MEGVVETAVVWRGLPAKQLIGLVRCHRQSVREKPALLIIYSHNLSNFYRIEDRSPCAFDSEHTSYWLFIYKVKCRYIASKRCKTQECTKYPKVIETSLWPIEQFTE
jgi:hypothetical protein